MCFYLGLTVPKGVPKPIIDQIADTTRKVLADQAFVEKTLDTFGFEPIGEMPEQFAEFLKIGLRHCRKEDPRHRRATRLTPLKT